MIPVILIMYLDWKQRLNAKLAEAELLQNYIPYQAVSEQPSVPQQQQDQFASPETFKELIN